MVADVVANAPEVVPRIVPAAEVSITCPWRASLEVSGHDGYGVAGIIVRPWDIGSCCGIDARVIDNDCLYGIGEGHNGQGRRKNAAGLTHLAPDVGK